MGGEHCDPGVAQYAPVNSFRWTMTDPGNGDSTDSEFSKHGYSKRSLEMLETEEGQLNAVFACYGSAAQHAQLFEEALASLLALLYEFLAPDHPIAALDKMTTGQLLRCFKKQFVEEMDDWVPEFLDETREQRNFLVHRYFLSRSEALGNKVGRRAMLEELLGIESKMRRGAALINGLSAAIEHEKTGQRRQKAQGETIFSVTLRSKLSQ